MLVRGENAVNPIRINEYFNKALAKIRLSKSGLDCSCLLMIRAKTVDCKRDGGRTSGGKTNGSSINETVARSRRSLRPPD